MHGNRTLFVHKKCNSIVSIIFQAVLLMIACMIIMFRNKRTDTSNGLAAQQGKDSKVFNPFKSRTPTWGFLQNKPVQNVTPPPAGATGGTKRGYDKVGEEVQQ